MDLLSTNVATTRVGVCVYARTCFFLCDEAENPRCHSNCWFVCFFLCVWVSKLAFTATKKLKNDGTTFVFHRAFREREMVFFFPARKGSLSLSLLAHISPHKQHRKEGRKGCPPRPRTNACCTAPRSSTINTTRRKEDRATAMEKL